MNKRTKSLILILALVFSSLQCSNAEAKVKLSETKKTLVVGKTATIKVAGANVSKWSVSNGKIRIIKTTKTSAKIKAVSKGNSYLKAKVGDSTYKCKVTVVTSNSNSNNSKGNFDSKKAKRNIDIDEFVANGKLFAKVSSRYKYATGISAKCTFYDSEGNPVDYHNDSISFLEKGHSGFLEFSLPSTSYSSYKISYEYSEGLKYLYHSSIIDNLSLETNYVKSDYSSYIMLQVSNSSEKECYYCEVAVVYYGSTGEILDVKKELIGTIPSGSSETEKAYTPYNSITYEDITYDHYDAFISYAYHLGK